VLSLATVFSSHVLPALALLQLSSRSTDLVFVFEFSFLVSLCFGIDHLSSSTALTDFSAVPSLAASLQLSPALVLLAISHLAVSFLFVSPKSFGAYRRCKGRKTLNSIAEHRSCAIGEIGNAISPFGGRRSIPALA
jgi:hypothetical protein